MQARFSSGWLLILLAVGALTCSQARASVEMTRLDATNLSKLAPQTRALGVVPGDILMSNPFMKVVLKATVEGDQSSIGKSILWHGLPTDAVQFEPGFGIGWNAAEAGCNGRVAVVRYRSSQSNWDAELVYKLFDNGPWLDVTLTLTNRDSEAKLEIPAIFKMHLPSTAKVDDKQGMVWVANGPNGQAAAIFPDGGRFLIQEQSKGNWWLSSISGDDEPGVVKRVSRSLPLIRRFAAERPNRPIEAGRDWPRQFHDRSSWYRIESGQQRVVHWKLVVGAGEEHTKSLVDFARRGNEPQIQLVPSMGTPMQPTPVAQSLPAPHSVARPSMQSQQLGQSVQPPPVVHPKRIVGHLRTAPGEQTPSVSAPAVSGSTDSLPTLSGPALTQPAPPAELQFDAEAGPLILPPGLQDFPELPAP